MSPYSDDRVDRLRLVLLVVLGVGGLLALFAVLLLFGDGVDRRAGIVGLVVAAVVLAAAGTAYRLLQSGSSRARTACVATGVVVVVAGLSLAGTWLAFVLPLLGVAVLFLALVGDEVDSRP